MVSYLKTIFSVVVTQQNFKTLKFHSILSITYLIKEFHWNFTSLKEQPNLKESNYNIRMLIGKNSTEVPCDDLLDTILRLDFLFLKSNQ